jgi:hypothetical protein
MKRGNKGGKFQQNFDGSFPHDFLMIFGKCLKEHNDFGNEVSGLHFNGDIAKRHKHGSTDQRHFI